MIALAVVTTAVIAFPLGWLTAAAQLTPRIRALEGLVYRLQQSRGWVL